MPRRRRVQPQPDVKRSSHTDRLSPVAENYLLSLYVLREEGVRATLSQLASYLKRIPGEEGLGTTLPTVAGMIRRLEREGLVELTSDKEIRLTTAGLVLAEDMARRHRLAERMVVDLLGVELHRAYVEAHRLEHAISPELLSKIVERLGNPKTNPFGRPIPGSGYDGDPAGVVSLDKCRAGVPYVVVRVPEEDQQLLQFLVEHGIVPDQEVVVRDAAPYRGVITISAAGTEVALGYEVAMRLWVRPQEGAAARAPQAAQDRAGA